MSIRCEEGWHTTGTDKKKYLDETAGITKMEALLFLLVSQLALRAIY